MIKMGGIDSTPLWGRLTATAVDRETSARYLIPPLVLMEEAGRSVARIIRDRITQDCHQDHQVVVLAGPGNNGGDALVTARYLKEWEIPTVILSILPEKDSRQSDSRAHQTKILDRLGHQLILYEEGTLLSFREANPKSHIWIVDGILGLGGRTDIREKSLLGAVLREAATLQNKTVLAIDLPSGLDPDNGSQTAVWLKADVTVTFGERKPALVLSPARDLCGEVICIDVGFPRQAVEDGLKAHPPLWALPDAGKLLTINPWLSLGRSAHKYDRGHVLIIGGSPGKTGAPLLSALSALRSGAGWATVAMPHATYESLKGEVPRDIVFEDLFGREAGEKAVLDDIKLKDFLRRGKVRSIVIGPGTMGTPLSESALAVIREFCLGGGFAVFDAGACHGLIPLLKSLKAQDSSPQRWVMTPHPGEWIKLGLDDTTPPLSPPAWAKSQAIAAQLGISMVYKSATPVLILGDGETPALVSNAGSKVLARAGSGDVLAGAIGAHGATGLGVATSVMRSLVILAQAAHIAALRLGEDAVMARDVIDGLGLPRGASKRHED